MEFGLGSSPTCYGFTHRTREVSKADILPHSLTSCWLILRMAGIIDIQAYMPDELEDPIHAIPCQSRERNQKQDWHNSFRTYSYAGSIEHRGLAATRWVGCYSHVEPQTVSSHCNGLLSVYYPRCHHHTLMHIQWTWVLVSRTRVFTGPKLQISV